MSIDKINVTKIATFAKSFYLLGNSLNFCYDCKYCRLNGEKQEAMNCEILPSELNPNFDKIPVAVNLFYGDPLLQIDNTVRYLRCLEKANHKGPVVIITKGDFSKFPDEKFNLDLHIAFSAFGVNSKMDGGTTERFENNLLQIKKRKNNYKYSIEYRPICNGINDSKEAFEEVLGFAREYNLAVGYSGLQGKPSSVKIWEAEKLNFKPYPGYTFGHKKLISSEVINMFEKIAKDYGVKVFRKTSCLVSYVHGYERDYNAHYYRPSEVGCNDCVMKEKCHTFKNNLSTDLDLTKVIPFKHEIVNKEVHECILKQKGICNFPSEECSHISGTMLKIFQKLTTSDVRVIKWLTGMTVDADFEESPYISEDWVTNKSLLLRKK